MKTKVFLLYGVAKRGDLVAMFFDNWTDLVRFREGLPGRYQVMDLAGVNYDKLNVLDIRSGKVVL